MRSCLDCGRLTREKGSRCVECRRARDRRRPSAARRGYDHEYRKARLAVLEEAGYICAYCGDVASTVDHLVPLSRGGSNDRENLAASCLACNVTRANRGRWR